MAVTVKDNSVQSINSALLRASKGGSGTTVKNVQNVTNVNQTTEIVKLADGTTLDIKGLRRTNSLLTGQIAELERQLKLLKSQVENIRLSSKDSGKTLVFSNYLDVDSETTVPVVVAQYSANGLDWHDTFVEGQDIYIRFSYDAGGEWTDPIKIVGEDGSSYAYYGLVYNYDNMPSDSTGNFFLCGQDFNGYGRLLINDSQLILNNNYILSVTRKFQKGYIYVYDGFIWQRLDDKNNFRYVIAMNDLIEIDEPLSPGLIEQFQSSIVVYTPKYLGGFAAAPITAHNGDTFCYTGTTTANYTKGMCYKWADGTGWSLLSTTDPENAQAYMSALNDILQNTSENGTFAAVFAQHICSNSAFIKNVASQVITLQSNGLIESNNYSATTGFQIKANGDAVFRQGTFDNINSTNSNFVNAVISGTFDSVGGYKYNKQLLLSSDQHSVNEMIDIIFNTFDNYNGKVLCYVYFDWLSDRYYRGDAFCLSIGHAGTVKNFSLIGYGAFTNTDANRMLVNFIKNSHEIWLIHGTENFHIPETSTDVRAIIYY